MICNLTFSFEFHCLGESGQTLELSELWFFARQEEQTVERAARISLAFVCNLGAML